MMHRPIAMVACALGFAAAAAGRAGAQGVVLGSGRLTSVGTLTDEYMRLMQLTGTAPLGSRMLRPGGDAPLAAAQDSAPWRSPWGERFAGDSSPSPARVRLTLLDVVTQGSHNSTYAYGANDGALWAGRGWSGQVTTGVRASMGPVTLQLAPTYTRSSNKAFPTGPVHRSDRRTSRYADIWESRGLDRPQRFGEKPVSRGDAGQSFARVDYRGAFVGYSNESMWWGPGVDNSLLMSNNAPGFAHAFIGTQSRSIGIGRLEALWTVGRMKTSNYWRLPGDTTLSPRWSNSLLLVFEPRGMPGMYFGAARVFYVTERAQSISGKAIWSIFQPFAKHKLATDSNPSGDDKSDQLLSLFVRWVFPSSGFEVYGEYGRNDHNWDRRDMVLEPDHSRALLMGARKVVRIGDGILSLGAEGTTLALTKTSIIRGSQSWYSHSAARGGYSHRGQLLGASIGPGSDAQSFTVDVLKPKFGAGFVIRRERENSDAFFEQYNIPFQGYHLVHDVKLGLGPRAVVFVGPATIRASFHHVTNYNRYFMQDIDEVNYFTDLRVELRPDWRPRRR